jgi:hypothetical protein
MFMGWIVKISRELLPLWRRGPTCGIEGGVLTTRLPGHKVIQTCRPEGRHD